LIDVMFSPITSLLEVAVATRYMVAAAAATTAQHLVCIFLSVTAAGKAAASSCWHCHGVNKAAAMPCSPHVVAQATAMLLPKPMHRHAVSKAASL